MQIIFSVIDSLIKRLFYSAELHSYESACLEAWKRKLSKGAIEILNRQLELFDLTQRLSRDKIVTFHCIKDRSYSSWSDQYLFPQRGEELLAATIWFRPTGIGSASKLRADIILHKGRLSSIEFSKSPRDVLKKEKARRENIEIVDVNILVDPMAADAYTTSPLTDISILTSSLRDWAQRWDVKTLRKPLPTKDREIILRNLATTLPPDYLELVGQTEGLEVEHCTIRGLSQIRTIVLPGMNFYILAEIEGKGAVGVKQHNKKCELYFIGNENETPELVGSSLRAFIERELETKKKP